MRLIYIIKTDFTIINNNNNNNNNNNITSYCVLSYVGVHAFIVYMCLMFPECLLGGGGGSDCLKRKNKKCILCMHVYSGPLIMKLLFNKSAKLKWHIRVCIQYISSVVVN